jgi:hypothetical protein
MMCVSLGDLFFLGLSALEKNRYKASCWRCKGRFVLRAKERTAKIGFSRTFNPLASCFLPYCWGNMCRAGSFG